MIVVLRFWFLAKWIFRWLPMCFLSCLFSGDSLGGVVAVVFLGYFSSVVTWILGF